MADTLTHFSPFVLIYDTAEEGPPGLQATCCLPAYYFAVPRVIKCSCCKGVWNSPKIVLVRKKFFVEVAKIGYSFASIVIKISFCPCLLPFFLVSCSLSLLWTLLVLFTAGKFDGRRAPFSDFHSAVGPIKLKPPGGSSKEHSRLTLAD